MPESLAAALVGALGIYAGVGILVAVWLQVRGLDRLDPAAAGAAWGFRILMIPGLVAFWPLLALRALRGGGPPAEHNAHRGAAEGRS